LWSEISSAYWRRRDRLAAILLVFELDLVLPFAERLRARYAVAPLINPGIDDGIMTRDDCAKLHPNLR
jgi:hypothetical protein